MTAAYYVFTAADWARIKTLLSHFSTVGEDTQQDEQQIYHLARMAGRHEHLVGELETAAKKAMPVCDADLLDKYKECEHGIFPPDEECPECNVSDPEGAEGDRRYDAKVDREHTDEIEEASKRG
jgi:hypothetical protein